MRKQISLTFIGIFISLFVDPLFAEVDQQSLDDLLQKAEKTHSDAVVIIHQGKIVGNWTFGKPVQKIESMSVTKSIVSLAIGRLLMDDYLQSIDQAVADFYPQWNTQEKNQVTIKHLLNHTSGLQANHTTEEIYKSENFVKFALDSELISSPGDQWFYNNRAVNILSGIVEKASGKRMDVYLADTLFKPLGIVDFSWTLDKAGNPHAMSGLQIYPSDLAKIGQLLLNDGQWEGNQLLDPDWIKTMTTSTYTEVSSHGLLWWLSYEYIHYEIDNALVESWRQKELDKEFLQQAITLKGVHSDFKGLNQKAISLWGKDWRTKVRKNIWSNGLKFWKKEIGPLSSFSADGYLGQKMMVFPKEQLVVVRMISENSYKDKNTDDFGDLPNYAKKLLITP